LEPPSGLDQECSKAQRGKRHLLQGCKKRRGNFPNRKRGTHSGKKRDCNSYLIKTTKGGGGIRDRSGASSEKDRDTSFSIKKNIWTREEEGTMPDDWKRGGAELILNIHFLVKAGERSWRRYVRGGKRDQRRTRDGRTKEFGRFK